MGHYFLDIQYATYIHTYVANGDKNPLICQLKGTKNVFLTDIDSARETELYIYI